MIKLGVLISDFESLPNWQLKIIEGIQANPDLELSLLIQDGRSKTNSKTSKLKKIWKSKNVLGSLLFKAQTFVERKLFKTPSYPQKKQLIQFLQTIPCIQLQPQKKNFVDLFSSEDAAQVQKYNLDVLLRHEFNIVRGPILEAAKYGMWSFHHGDNAINRGQPPGFWEIVLKQSVIGVTLQQLTPELDGGLVIDKGFYNLNWSYIKNRNSILERSTTLLFKNLNRLKRGEFAPQKSPAYYNPLYKIPSFATGVKYCTQFYKNLIINRCKKFNSTFFGSRYACWTLFIGKGDFFEKTLFRLKPTLLPKGEFWADPFLVQHGGQTYVFFENYIYATKRGKISCGRVQNRRILDVCDVMDFDYHLSYPFLFKEDGELYMIPETHENRRVEIYRCTDFPTKWELYTTAFEGEDIVDTTYYKDHNGDRWLFLNKNFYQNCCPELYIYKVDSLHLKQIEPHQQNPVLIDSRIARNAGAIFQQNGKIIRPSQNNSNGVYGYGLNLREIVQLDLENYVEKPIFSIEPNFKEGLIACHHLHQMEGEFVLDAAYKKYRL